METMKKMKDWAEILCTEIEEDQSRDTPLNRESFLLFWNAYHHTTAKLQISNPEDLEVKESLARQIFEAWLGNRSVMSVIKQRNKINFKQYTKVKLYNGRKLDDDMKSNFASFLKHRANLYLPIATWDQFFDAFVVDDPIFKECGKISAYPIVVYSVIDEPGHLEIIPYAKLDVIPNNWHFERRFKDMDTALKVTENWDYDEPTQSTYPSKFIKTEATLEEALKGTIEAWRDEKIGGWELEDPLDEIATGKAVDLETKVELETENNLFDQKFLHAMWTDDLDGKECFYADDIPNLKKAVENNIIQYKDKLRFSGNEFHPFKAELYPTSAKEYVFAYYDPNYEVKWAKKCLAEKRDADPIYQVKEKIERLDANNALKEILWDLVKLVEGKADKDHSHFSLSEIKFGA